MTDISAINGTAAGGNGIATEGGGALGKLNEDFDSFLTLLTTQLQNQDPLDPVDTSEFTNQLVQFASVEQLIQQSDLMKDMLASDKSNEATMAVNYIGTRVEVPTTAATLADGRASWSYTLPEDADDAAIQIVDGDGNIMATYLGATDGGTHNVVWDVQTADGETAEDGTYFLRVAAVNENGEIFPQVKSLATVNGVAFDDEDGSPLLAVNGELIPLSEVSAVTL